MYKYQNYSVFLPVIFLGLFLCLASCQREDRRIATLSAPDLLFERHFDSLLYLPEGWTSTLWAESPQLHNPTNMDVDEHGRIWVTEAVNYRSFKNDSAQFPFQEDGDRVVILSDTDNDGYADISKVFVQDTDLVAPLGIAVCGDKVIVSCAPHLIIYTDSDGDDVPEKKEILLTGFGGLDHDHSLHAVITGPDGKWYFNTGNAGPHIVTDHSGWTLRSGSVYFGGTPYNTENRGAQISDDGRIWVGGLALSVNPDGTGLQVLAHNFRNAYELTIDSYGDLWQNDNDDQVETCRSTWLMHGGNAGYFSEDGRRTWRADRRPGLSNFEAHWHQRDPGVIPAGDNTGAGSPTGVMVYEGDAFGEKYRGMFLNVDAGRNVLFAYQPKMRGAGYDLESQDLVTTFPGSTADYIWKDLSEDRRKWFRPSDVAAGTDGAIYVADWYDAVVGGHYMKDTLAYGRIYRIAPAGSKVIVPKYDLSSTKGQLEALCSPAINVRNLGFVKLKETGQSAIPAISELMHAENPFHRARALWLLVAIGGEGLVIAENVLSGEENPRLRIAAYRALIQKDPTKLMDYAKIASLDPSPAVRSAVAISMRDQTFEQSFEIIEHLFNGFDGEDRWYLEALGLAADGKETEVYKQLHHEESQDPIEWSIPFARLVWRLHPLKALDPLATRAASDRLEYGAREEALTAIAFIGHARAAQHMMDLATSHHDPRIQKMASWWLTFRRNNLWHNIIDWPSDTMSLLPDSLALLIAHLSETDNALKQMQAATKLAQHPIGAKQLINLAATNRLPIIIKHNRQVADLLLTNEDQEVRMLASKYFKSAKKSNLSMSKIAALQGQVDRGNTLFSTKCGLCHRMGNVGQDIGPELTEIRRKYDRNALAEAIVYPDAAVTFGYEPLYITTKNDQVFSGFLLSDGEVMVLKDLSGKKHSVPSNEIRERVIKDISLMPDPTALGLEEQDVADIITFLLVQ